MSVVVFWRLHSNSSIQFGCLLQPPLPEYQPTMQQKHRRKQAPLDLFPPKAVRLFDSHNTIRQ